MDTTENTLGLAAAIAAITDLNLKSQNAEIVLIDTKGLATGLPAQIPVQFNRKEQALQSVKKLIDEHRLVPERRTGTASVDTLASFIKLTDRHKDEGSVLFGKTVYPDPKLTAILNYHSVGNDARFGDHRIEYAFPLTEEFKAWVAINNKPMDQEIFAAFLEEHSVELASPSEAEISLYQPLFSEKFATPSEVVMLARSLEVLVNAKVKQGVRLQSGERTVEFSEEHVNAKGEKIVIPGIFMVSVRAFVDGEPVRIPARLRYRIAGGEIKWFYQLYRWQEFVREQVQYDLRDAAEKTALPYFEGSPER